MKINKAKLLVGTLAIASVAATVGSISGTVAWFQYSTRSTVAYQGAAAHCSENLQVRLFKMGTTAADDIKTDWKQDLIFSDISGFLASSRTAAANTLRPVTSGKLGANEVPTNLYRNPIYQYAKTSDWGVANENDYVDLPIQFRVLDVDGKSTETFLAKKIYLTDVTLAATTGTTDISNALRVIVDNKETATDKKFAQVFSSDGTAVAVGGELDLNNDKAVDQTEGYEFTTGRTNVKYGDWTTGTSSVAETASSQAVTAKAAGDTDLKIADDSQPFAIKGRPLLTSSVPGTSEAAADKRDWAGITIRIYLEGWTSIAALGDNTKNATPALVWDAAKTLETAATKPVFNVGLRFTAEAHTDH